MKWFKIETFCFIDWTKEISYRLFENEKKAREYATELTDIIHGSRCRVVGFASKSELLEYTQKGNIQLDALTKSNVENDCYYYDTITPTTEVFKIVPTGYPGEREELPYSEDRLFYGNWWYLHGLEDIFGYDKAWFLDLPEQYLVDRYLDKYEFKESFINGIVECQVEGYDGPCTGYFWVTPEGIQRGLVCPNSDIEANKDAKERYDARVTYL